MTETPNPRPDAVDNDIPAAAPFSSGVERGVENRDDPDRDTQDTEEPAAGVTDVYGHSLAGSPLGGAMGS